MKNVKLIVLDMDGVINSNILIKKWLIHKAKELRKLNKKSSVQELQLLAKQEFKLEFNNSKELIFPELAYYITNICNKADAYILWSSSWRLLKEYQDINNAKEMFNRRGLPGDRLLGYTPQLHYMDQGIRGNQIRIWLYNNSFFTYNDLYKCAVIDDSYDAGEMLPDKCVFFQTNIKKGITKSITNKIIKYLTK